MNYQITFVTTENLGDHGREVREAFAPIEGETVADLLHRISEHADRRTYRPMNDTSGPRFATVDHVELRLVAGRET